VFDDHVGNVKELPSGPEHVERELELLPVNEQLLIVASDLFHCSPPTGVAGCDEIGTWAALSFTNDWPSEWIFVRNNATAWALYAKCDEAQARVAIEEAFDDVDNRREKAGIIIKEYQDVTGGRVGELVSARGRTEIFGR
jgi:hypothetical protein